MANLDLHPYPGMTCVVEPQSVDADGHLIVSMRVRASRWGVIWLLWHYRREVTSAVPRWLVPYVYLRLIIATVRIAIVGYKNKAQND